MKIPPENDFLLVHIFVVARKKVFAIEIGFYSWHLSQCALHHEKFYLQVRFSCFVIASSAYPLMGPLLHRWSASSSLRNESCLLLTAAVPWSPSKRISFDDSCFFVE